MMLIAPGVQEYSLTASTVASVLVQTIKHVQETGNNFVSIDKGFLIAPPHSEYKARILRPFSIYLRVVEGEFIATSIISDLYEPGESAGKAALHYLYSLLDELIWLQDNEEKLSASLLEVLKNIRLYVKLM